MPLSPHTYDFEQQQSFITSCGFRRVRNLRAAYWMCCLSVSWGCRERSAGAAGPFPRWPAHTAGKLVLAAGSPPQACLSALTGGDASLNVPTVWRLASSQGSDPAGTNAGTSPTVVTWPPRSVFRCSLSGGRPDSWWEGPPQRPAGRLASRPSS